MDLNNIGSLPNLFMVGFFWGVTNPFLKRGTAGVNNIKEDNRFLKIMKEIMFLATNWKYMTPFLINQCGSILYYFSLKDSDLTLAVPICNSLAFVWTAVVGWWLGEEIPNRSFNVRFFEWTFSSAQQHNAFSTPRKFLEIFLGKASQIGMMMIAIGISCYLMV